MTKLNEVYKCEVCGNIVEVVHAAGGKLVCCNSDMVLKTENSVDAATEKHIPVVESTDEGVKVTVGSVEHPMEDKHYIEWIEFINGTYVNRKYLKPGDKPMAEFYVKYSDKLIVKAYCNLHGLWKSA